MREPDFIMAGYKTKAVKKNKYFKFIKLFVAITVIIYLLIAVKWILR